MNDKELIENFVTAAIPGGIEAQERRGQGQFVNAETLPRHFNYGTRQELEQMGVKFGKDVDDLFCEVTLPEGWRKEATDHSMWSKLYDDKGRERASIFYKAAFYDRNAHINVGRRYGYDAYVSCDELGNTIAYDDPKATHYKTVITDAKTPIYTVAIRSKEDYSDATDRHCAAAKLWLSEHYPEWESNTAYWDAPEAQESNGQQG